MTKQDTVLGGHRVLDLTDEKGLLCGRVLGEFGADVIKIECPGGDPSRRIGPFYKSTPDPEKSLFWFAFNTNKRGITLDIEHPDGREIFKKLVKTADLVIESFDPGYMDAVGLGYSGLESINPRIIMTSITPFGQTGPYSHYKATDLTAAAMGGLARITGDLGRPPVRMSCDPQSYCQAGLHGALGSTVALYHREITGEGQHVDVSMQQAVALSTMNAMEVYDMMKVNLIGMGQFYVNPRPVPYGLLFMRFVHRCKDGFVVLYFAGGFGGIIESTFALVKWANSEGKAMALKDVDWSKWDGSTIAAEDLNAQYAAIGEFLITKTKDELFEEAVKRGIFMAPCCTAEDIFRNRHLQARGFWVTVDHTELGDSLLYPGAPVIMKGTPWRITRRAPLIGEHNEEIYKRELGYSDAELAILEARNVI